MRLFAIMVIDPDSCDEQVHGGRCLGRGLVNDRFLILKRKHRLNGKEHMMLSGRLQNYPALAMAHEVKEAGSRIHEASTRDEADTAPGSRPWRRQCIRCAFPRAVRGASERPCQHCRGFPETAMKARINHELRIPLEISAVNWHCQTSHRQPLSMPRACPSDVAPHQEYK